MFLSKWCRLPKGLTSTVRRPHKQAPLWCSCWFAPDTFLLVHGRCLPAVATAATSPRHDISGQFEFETRRGPDKMGAAKAVLGACCLVAFARALPAVSRFYMLGDAVCHRQLRTMPSDVRCCPVVAEEYAGARSLVAERIALYSMGQCGTSTYSVIVSAQHHVKGQHVSACDSSLVHHALA